MKNSLLFVFLVFALLMNVAGQAQIKYSIKGKLNSRSDGDIYLVAFSSKQDTLEFATIKNGRFEFKGELSEPVMATIFLGKRDRMNFVLEGAKYILTEMPDSSLCMEGGEQQELYERYQLLQKKMAKDDEAICKAYAEAEKIKDEAGMKKALADFDRNLESYHKQENALIAEQADSFVASVMVFNVLKNMDFERIMPMSIKPHWNYQILKEKYQLLGNRAKATYWGKIVVDYVNKQERVAVGAIAPDFQLTTPEGQQISLHGLRAKVKVIDFWASWCGPCRRENPNMVRIYKKYHEKGLEILGVSLDKNKEEWMKAILEDGLIWKHGSDLKVWKSVPVRLYNINSVPSTILLDENNRIVAKNLRGEELEKAIEKLLK